MTFFPYLFVMAAITYLVRMIPLAAVKGKIKNKFLLSFLHYIPYAVLSVMTIPAIFTSTSSVLSATAGLTVALVLSYFEKSLVLVAASSCITVFIFEFIIKTL